MTDLSVIILTGREELHIKRCLEKLAPLEPKQVFVVESQKGDKTHEIAASMGATCFYHEWPGNQARQFNWFIDNHKIETTWVLRIDADEWLTPELIEEIKQKIGPVPTSSLNTHTSSLDADVVGVVLKRRHYFAGGWAKHGTYPVRILRLYRTGHARYDDSAMMDERLEVQGKVIEFEHDFVDESLISMDVWRDKHRNYAKREAAQALEGLKTGHWTDPRKSKYYKLPPYLRAFAYFAIRYCLKGGILDGYPGWMWNFWQGLWYRCLVDREIATLRKQSISSVRP